MKNLPFAAIQLDLEGIVLSETVTLVIYLFKKYS